ncbi:MAG: hypothetical protein IPH82_22440 [Chloroflexi bacterium]|nr:hypothetical protein [Chloroflexota bacterium]
MAQKDAQTELWQLKTAVTYLAAHLNQGVIHLDDMSGKIIARALTEIVQEVVSMPRTTTEEDLDQFTADVLSGTETMQQELAGRWQEDLQPLMDRTQQRAAELDHNLGEFTPLSVNGQRWGAICLKCLRWVTISPNQAGGQAILNRCTGWLVR